MYVPGLRSEEVSSMGDVIAITHRGKQNRSTFATNMNEHSSRSHLVLSVYVLAAHKSKGVCICVSVCLPVFLPVCLSACLSVCLPVLLSVCPSVRPSVCRDEGW